VRSRHGTITKPHAAGDLYSRPGNERKAAAQLEDRKFDHVPGEHGEGGCRERSESKDNGYACMGGPDGNDGLLEGVSIKIDAVGVVASMKKRQFEQIGNMPMPALQRR
jgi:hypothetical protein